MRRFPGSIVPPFPKYHEKLRIAIILSLSSLAACQKTTPPVRVTPASAVVVASAPSGPLTVSTSSARFSILASGYLQTSLMKDGKWITLDATESGAGALGPTIYAVDREFHLPLRDLAGARIFDISGKFGETGKRIEVREQSTDLRSIPIETTLALEVYDNFPTMALVRVAIRNVGSNPIALERTTPIRRRLNSSLAAPQAKPFEMMNIRCTKPCSGPRRLSTAITWN